jgi:hypothetical protein
MNNFILDTGRIGDLQSFNPFNPLSRASSVTLDSGRTCWPASQPIPPMVAFSKQRTSPGVSEEASSTSSVPFEKKRDDETPINPNVSLQSSISSAPVCAWTLTYFRTRPEE